MASRSELEIRASAIGVVSASYPNDSKLEQAIIYAEKIKTPSTAAVKATTTLTSTGVAADGNTITIGGRTYTLVTTLDNATANQIFIGGSASITLDNIKAALSPTQIGSGTQWSTPTVPHSEILCGAKTATTLVVTASRTGVAGNSIATTKVAANFAWTGATMSGGVEGTGPRAEDIAAISGGANV